MNRWIKRIFLAVPFVIAAVLNILMVNADRLHLRREHITGYGFLFATPWAWLLDRGWFSIPHNRWLQTLFAYAVFLWIPAILYSGFMWLLFSGIAKFSHRSAHMPD